jgi:hypothetical protein
VNHPVCQAGQYIARPLGVIGCHEYTHYGVALILRVGNDKVAIANVRISTILVIVEQVIGFIDLSYV